MTAPRLWQISTPPEEIATLQGGPRRCARVDFLLGVACGSRGETEAATRTIEVNALDELAFEPETIEVPGVRRSASS
jgi:hypothetical protein